MGFFDSEGFCALAERLDRIEKLIQERVGSSLKPGWLNLSEASKYSGLSERTLRRAIRAGKLRSARQAGKLLFKAEWLDKFILYGKQRLTATERARL